MSVWMWGVYVWVGRGGVVVKSCDCVWNKELHVLKGRVGLSECVIIMLE